MATDKSIELFLETSPPESKSSILNQGLFRLSTQLNNFIRSPGFCGFSRIPNRSEGGISCYVESSVR